MPLPSYPSSNVKSVKGHRHHGYHRLNISHNNSKTNTSSWINMSLFWRHVFARVEIRHIWLLVLLCSVCLLHYQVDVYQRRARYWKRQYQRIKHPLDGLNAIASWDEQVRYLLNHSVPERHGDFPLPLTSPQFDKVLQEVYHPLFASTTAATTKDTTDSDANEGNDDFWLGPDDTTMAPSAATAIASTTATDSRPEFDVTEWEQSGKATTGGLLQEDRMLLGQIYSQANSILEYGLGESTLMADHLKVPRYVGIDSDPTYVAKTRASVNNPQFRFYFADIGPTKEWGFPKQPWLPKNVLNYQLMPLLVEPKPFEVYLIDGRWRLGCMLLSFLHASARAGSALPQSQTVIKLETIHPLPPLNENDNQNGEHHSNEEDEDEEEENVTKLLTPPLVLIHDCKPLVSDTDINRRAYKQADQLLHMVFHSGAKLCVYQRKNTTTDEQLFQLWHRFHHVVG